MPTHGFGLDPVSATAELADGVVAATLSVAGVTGLHAGSYGEVGTHLPGRRVDGVRLLAEVTEVHVTVAMGSVLPQVARRVSQAVQPLVGHPVHVFVEDVTPV
jgi:phage replication-related protein YjqB (UPF0714/DUF867 family)